MAKTGTVKNWNEGKGFGSVGPDECGDDLFVHRAALMCADLLDRGDSLNFDELSGKSRAIDVSVGGGGGGGGGGSRGGDRYSGGGGRDDYGRGGREDCGRGGCRDDYGHGGGRRPRSHSH